MSQQNYTITNYGIVIPIDESEQYNYVVKKLISKNKKFYKDLDGDEFDYSTKPNNHYMYHTMLKTSKLSH